MQRYTPVIPALRRLKEQENRKSRPVTLAYTHAYKTARYN